MHTTTIGLITIASPAFFIVTAVLSYFQPGKRPRFIKALSTLASIVSIIAAAFGGYFVFQHGLLESGTFGYQGFGMSFRLDSISALMFGMIALLGFIVVRFSQNYMDGDARQGAFMGRLAMAIGTVQLLVLSGNLGILFLSWVFTSMALHKLLLFYPERPGAIIAARKKFLVARLGDLSLLVAVGALYNTYETGNLELIFQQIASSMKQGSVPNSVELAALFFALAALLKSAQFPTHGWLIEVMETPTPVSALLHAGLLNAGPFLIIRMAYVMEASTIASTLLIVIGGFTALFASVVYLTQTSIKTALGYTSIAHMGFSLMVCGLGVFPAAMLHLVAHSFYKAHAFLSTGSVIDTLRAKRITGVRRTGSWWKIAVGIALGLGVYTVFAMLWGIDLEKERSLLAIGAVIALGLSRLFTSAIDSNGSFKLVVQATLLSLLVSLSFFSLESAMHTVLVRDLPELGTLSLSETISISILLLLFATALFIQIAAPLLRPSERYQRWEIHLKNGLYVNTQFDRVVRALHAHGSLAKPVFIEHKEEIKSPSATSTYSRQPLLKT